jgi:hypothetical protein
MARLIVVNHARSSGLPPLHRCSKGTRGPEHSRDVTEAECSESRKQGALRVQGELGLVGGGGGGQEGEQRAVGPC